MADPMKNDISAYYANGPVNSTQWDANAVEANAQARQAATGDQIKQAPPTFFDKAFNMAADVVMKPVEAFGALWHAAYSPIARAVTTPFIASDIASAESKTNGTPGFHLVNWGAWDNFLFSANTWDRAWKDAAHVSPGQAINFNVASFMGDKTIGEQMQAPIMAPMRNAQGKMLDANGNVTEDRSKAATFNANQQGYIWDNPYAVQSNYDHGIQKWTSGAMDAEFNILLDPLAFAGKGAGLARKAVYVRPTVVNGISQSQKIVDSSGFTGLGDVIEAQKKNLGDQFNDWAANQNWAKNSPKAMPLISQLNKATDRGQIDLILATALGDQRAVDKLTAQNGEIGAAMKNLLLNQKGKIDNWSPNLTPIEQAQHEAVLNALTDAMSDLQSQQNSITDALATHNAMKNGLYFNPQVSPLVSNFGQYARGLQTASPLEALKSGGIGHASMALVYNNLYVRPVRIISGTTFRGIRAPGHINIDSDDSYKALGASVDQSKVFTPEERNAIVGKYIDLAPADRAAHVEQVDQLAFQRIASKYGLADDQAAALYRTIGDQRAMAKSGRVYSTAFIKTADGGSYRADHVDDAGNLVATTPVFESQLQNTSIMHDYDYLNRVMKYTAQPFAKLFEEEKIRARAAKGKDLNQAEVDAAQSTALEQVKGEPGAKVVKALEVGKTGMDLINKLWKFNALFRVGYGIRAISDDLLGQAAYFGATQTFLDRAARGGMGQVLRTMNKRAGRYDTWHVMAEGMDSGIELLEGQVQHFQSTIDRIQAYTPKPGKDLLPELQTNDLAHYQQKLDAAQQKLYALRRQRNEAGIAYNRLGDDYVIAPDGTAYPRPFGGAEGAMMKDLNSGAARHTYDVAMGGNAAEMLDHFRSGSWEAISRDHPEYGRAWGRVLTKQLMNDRAAMAYLRGQTLQKWARTEEGSNYLKQFGGSGLGYGERLERVAATVDHLLPSFTPETAALRQAVINGEVDKIPELIKGVGKTHGPESIQIEGIQYAMGKGDTFGAIDKLMGNYYNVMNKLPSEILSRNPLFFQLYRQHVLDLHASQVQQGVTHLSPAAQNTVVTQARQLALKDVKKFTYNMDFEGKLAYKMRFMAPFFGPMQESFSRWGHIVADKPEILGKAAAIYTAPIRAGWAVDENGNPIGEDGYVTDPQTGERKLASKAGMQIQIPPYLTKAIGVDGGTTVSMPINTLNLTLQNDPWYNPGTGPWVQMPANWAALHEDPKVGDALLKLGVLQQVTPDYSKQVLGSGTRFLLSEAGLLNDTEQQQKDMIYLMQAENYKYQTGVRDTAPTYQEIKDKAGHAATLRGFFKAVSPVSFKTSDPYQFFRDQYNNLQRADPKTADQVFLAKYGEAAFAFTGALTTSRNNLPATVEAMHADEKYKDLIADDPDAAALIVAPYRSANFSQTVYAQQFASGERSIADARDVMDRAQANAGWAQYDKLMNDLRARMLGAGFNSFDDHGAEQFNAERKGIVMALTESKLPDGTANDMYNEQFAKNFLTVDKSKDERRAAVLGRLVTEQSLMNDKTRQDMQGLGSYMDARNEVQRVLQARAAQGGSGDINAQQNLDVKLQFSGIINSLVETNTMFQSLHDRFLGHDMFDHADPQLAALEAGR